MNDLDKIIYTLGLSELHKNWTTTDIINHTLILEASDILKMTAGTANEIQGIISYAQLDRSQENG